MFLEIYTAVPILPSKESPGGPPPKANTSPSPSFISLSSFPATRTHHSPPIPRPTRTRPLTQFPWQPALRTHPPAPRATLQRAPRLRCRRAFQLNDISGRHGAGAARFHGWGARYALKALAGEGTAAVAAVRALLSREAWSRGGWSEEGTVR